jgi:putative flippase GtrA
MFKRFINEIRTLSRAQVSAFIGGTVDYFSMIFITEVFHVNFSISILFSGLIGAAVNFSINRQWTFNAKGEGHPVFKQLLRFLPVVLNSIFLKSFLTTLIVEILSVDYKISRLIVDTIVSVAVNYPLQRFWVFRRKSY